MKAKAKALEEHLSETEEQCCRRAEICGQWYHIDESNNPEYLV